MKIINLYKNFELSKRLIFKQPEAVPKISVTEQVDGIEQTSYELEREIAQLEELEEQELTNLEKKAHLLFANSMWLLNEVNETKDLSEEKRANLRKKCLAIGEIGRSIQEEVTKYKIEEGLYMMDHLKKNGYVPDSEWFQAFHSADSNTKREMINLPTAALFYINDSMMQSGSFSDEKLENLYSVWLDFNLKFEASENNSENWEMWFNNELEKRKII